MQRRLYFAHDNQVNNSVNDVQLPINVNIIFVIFIIITIILNDIISLIYLAKHVVKLAFSLIKSRLLNI